jgi:hypothetical protein
MAWKNLLYFSSQATPHPPQKAERHRLTLTVTLPVRLGNGSRPRPSKLVPKRVSQGRSRGLPEEVRRLASTTDQELPDLTMVVLLVSAQQPLTTCPTVRKLPRCFNIRDRLGGRVPASAGAHLRPPATTRERLMAGSAHDRGNGAVSRNRRGAGPAGHETYRRLARRVHGRCAPTKAFEVQLLR